VRQHRPVGQAIRKAPPTYAAGVSATIAIWLAEGRHSENDARLWFPMAPQLPQRREREFPPAEHRLFEMAEMALSVGAAHDAYRWSKDRARPIDVRAITEGMIARPIGRREFDALRRRQEEV